MEIVRKNIQELRDFLAETRSITLVCHTKPDGDAIGSLLGLYHILKDKHEVSMIAPSEVPDYLSWMPDSDHIVEYSEENADVCQEILADSELIFCLDFSWLNRVGDFEEMLSKQTCPMAMIDHHLDPGDFDTYRFWSNEAAATCQLIYQLMEEWGETDKVSKEAASSLYLGIMTDTGSFKFSNTTPKVLRIAADLIEKGADNAVICQKIYDRNSETRLRLLGHLLANKLVLVREHKTAYFIVDEATHKQFDIQSGDTEGVVNFALSLDGIIFATMISWSEKYTKLSLRSKGTFSARDVAQKYFQGGGHLNASGGRFDGSVADAEKTFLSALKDFSTQLEEEYQKLEEQ
jgi:bifunctional oligoribonuclease and PAP phosphatase NrnA